MKICEITSKYYDLFGPFLLTSWKKKYEHDLVRSWGFLLKWIDLCEMLAYELYDVISICCD